MKKKEFRSIETKARYQVTAKARRAAHVSLGLCRNNDGRLVIPGRQQCAHCLMKHRALSLWYKFKITFAEHRGMLEDQNFSCAICGWKCLPKHRSLNVDHNHKTGQVRGLLCWPCNVGLGKFKDNPQSLRSAADYLEAI